MNRFLAPRTAAVVAVAGVVAGVAGGCSDPATHAAPRPPVSSTADAVPPDDDDAGLGAPAPSQVVAHRPTRLELPSGALVRIDASATAADGELAIPTDVDRAGWWDGSSRIGDPFGGIVVAAHVDSFDQGLGRFAELLSVRRGESIVVTGGALRQEFRIVSARLVPKSSVAADAEIFSVKGEPRLVLITCGGAYDQANGGYQDNLIVIAEPIAQPVQS